MTTPYTIPHDADTISNSITKVVNRQTSGTLASNTNLAENSVIKNYVDSQVASSGGGGGLGTAIYKTDNARNNTPNTTLTAWNNWNSVYDPNNLINIVNGPAANIDSQYQIQQTGTYLINVTGVLYDNISTSASNSNAYPRIRVQLSQGLVNNALSKSCNGIGVKNAYTQYFGDLINANEDYEQSFSLQEIAVVNNTNNTANIQNNGNCFGVSVDILDSTDVNDNTKWEGFGIITLTKLA
jgi:hypothetical protein